MYDNDVYFYKENNAFASCYPLSPVIKWQNLSYKWAKCGLMLGGSKN